MPTAPDRVDVLILGAGTDYGVSNVMGMRIRLKSGFDISGYSAANQVILTAMKKYGMILADNGSNWYVSGAPSPCVSAAWTTVATRVKAGGAPVLLVDSQAQCVPNGTGVLVAPSQVRVRGM